MSDLSNYAENALYNHLLGRTSFTMPTGAYLALFSSVTDAEAGTGTEASGGNYSRQNVTSAMGAPTNGSGSNTSIVTFASMPAGTWTHAALFDAASSGNPLTAIKALTSPVTTAAGDDVRFPVSNLNVIFA